VGKNIYMYLMDMTPDIAKLCILENNEKHDEFSSKNINKIFKCPAVHVYKCLAHNTHMAEANEIPMLEGE
jgi:hypothetical protein